MRQWGSIFCEAVGDSILAYFVVIIHMHSLIPRPFSPEKGALLPLGCMLIIRGVWVTIDNPNTIASKRKLQGKKN